MPNRGMLYALPALALLALLALALPSLHAYGFGVKQNPYLLPAPSSTETQPTNIEQENPATPAPTPTLTAPASPTLSQTVQAPTKLTQPSVQQASQSTSQSASQSTSQSASQSASQVQAYRASSTASRAVVKPASMMKALAAPPNAPSQCTSFSPPGGTMSQVAGCGPRSILSFPYIGSVQGYKLGCKQKSKGKDAAIKGAGWGAWIGLIAGVATGGGFIFPGILGGALLGAATGAAIGAEKTWSTGCEASPSCGIGKEISRESCSFYGAGTAYCCDSVSRLEISPSAANVQAGAQLQFTVKAYDFDNNVVDSTNYVVEWSVVNTTLGSIASGLFTAATVIGQTAVRAARNGVVAEANVSVVPNNLSSIAITPMQVTLQSGTFQAFQAFGYDQYGNAVLLSDVNWTSSNATVGQMAGSTFFASKVGDANVTASVCTVNGSITSNCSQQGAVVIKSNAAIVAVSAGPPARVEVTPSSVTLNASETQQFLATGYDVNNNSVAITPTWAIAGESVGSIDSTGFFTAAYAFNGSRAGQVTATYQSLNGVANVTVLDNIPPNVTYASPTPDGGQLAQDWFLANATFNEAVASATLSVNGSNTTMTLQPGNLSAAALSGLLNDGYYEFRVYATDAAGNLGVGALRNVTINPQNKPTITLNSPANGSTIRPGTVIDLSISGEGLQEAWYSVNGSANTSLPSPYDISTMEWSDGNYSIEVYANNTMGALSSAAYMFAVLGTGIEGYVLQANGTPVSGALVEIDDTTTNATTNAAGYYSLLGIAAGTYNLTASKAGYTNDSEKNVVVTAGSATQVNFTISQLAVLQGYVRDDVGGAIDSSSVSFSSAGYNATATTNATGYYAVYVQAGTYSCIASKNYSYVNQTISGIVLAEGGAANVNFTLTRTGSVSGIVYNDTGASPVPLAGATITIAPTAGSWYTTNTTIADGTYSIAGIAPGIYNVTATAAGFAPSTISGIVVNKAEDTVVIPFYLA